MVSTNEAYFESLILSIDEAELGQMFGKRCGKLNKKAFAAFYKDKIVFKLGREEVNHLIEKYIGSKNWDPSEKNRGMKDWIQIPEEYKSDWETLMSKAVEYNDLNK